VATLGGRGCMGLWGSDITEQADCGVSEQQDPCLKRQGPLGPDHKGGRCDLASDRPPPCDEHTADGDQAAKRADREQDRHQPLPSR